ncbi:MAG: hypothetical protein E6713_02240 [Sporomusaceae bacterium]|nr:hypothetical protein [Sporomusaceae bacterium]
MKWLVCLWIGLFCLTPLTCFACDCDEAGATYYKHFATKALAYAAQEFDKTAPAPGVDWSGDKEEWFLEAARQGWAEKTKASEGKQGAIILVKQQGQVMEVGVVCNADAKQVKYRFWSEADHLEKKQLQLDTMPAGMTIAYIYPEKVDRQNQRTVKLFSKS